MTNYNKLIQWLELLKKSAEQARKDANIIGDKEIEYMQLGKYAAYSNVLHELKTNEAIATELLVGCEHETGTILSSMLAKDLVCIKCHEHLFTAGEFINDNR